MRPFRIEAVLASLMLATTILPAAAEEPGGVTVTLGLGAAIAPDYFGAGTTSVGPTGGLRRQGAGSAGRLRHRIGQRATHRSGLRRAGRVPLRLHARGVRQC
jgi:hypothetical protein